jgi:Flp pilus assembly protein TadD
LLEKLPFFALVLASVAVTLWATASGAGVHPPTSVVPLSLRTANAVVSYVRYLGKLVWPSGLTPHYPHPYMPEIGGEPWAIWQLAAAALLLLVVSGLVIRSARPYALMGWLWYVGSLLPTAGLVQFAPLAIADRFAYWPLVGIFVVIAWGGGECVERLRAHRAGAARALVAAAGAFLAAYTFVSWQQVQHWRDSLTLFTHAVSVTPRNPVMRSSLGNALIARGDIEAAIEQHRIALEIFPNFIEEHYNLANALVSRGDLESAIPHYRRSLELKPHLIEARTNLGLALLQLGAIDEAVGHLRTALSQKEGPHLHRALGSALMRGREYDEAIAHFRRAVEMDSTSHDAHADLGRALELAGDPKGAVLHYREALDLDPDSQRARQGLVRALGRPSERNAPAP